MLSEFEKTVISKLEDIDSRLVRVEEKVDEATSFANSIVGEGGVMPKDSMENIKNAFASMLNPQGTAKQGESFVSSDESLGDLVSSLKSFQSRLASVRDAMSDLPVDDEK
mgnify:CR=1 FL=1